MKVEKYYLTKGGDYVGLSFKRQIRNLHEKN